MRLYSIGKILIILLFVALPIAIINCFKYPESSVSFPIGFLLLLCSLPFFLEKKREIYNPVLVLSAMFFIKYGLGSIYIYSYPSYFNRYLDLKILTKGLYFSIFCFISFLFGYYSINYSKLIRRIVSRIISVIPNINKLDLKMTSLPITLLMLLSIGWGSRYLIIKFGAYYHLEAGQSALATELIHFSQFVVFGSTLPLIALCFAFLKFLEKKRRISLFFITIILLISEIAYFLPSGSKEKVLLPIFILLVIYSIQERTPIKALFLSSTIFLLFIFPLVNIYKNYYTSRSVYDRFVEAIDIYGNSLLLFDIAVYKDILFSIFGERLNYAHIIGIIVENTPNIWNFQIGSTYVLFFTSLIPRVIWTGKPIIAGMGNEFGRSYGLIASNDYITSVGMSWIGELFINFGWFGIFFTFLYGLLYRVIFVYFFRNGRPNILGSVFYAFALFLVVRQGMFAAQFSGLLKYYLVLLIVLIPFTKKVREQN